MTRHGADTVEDDYLDESNLQTFSFTSQPECCKKCDCPEPFCHECCGKCQLSKIDMRCQYSAKKALSMCEWAVMKKGVITDV